MPTNKSLPIWLAIAALLLMFGLAVTSLKQKSPTFDEQGFLVRGIAYLRNENRHMRVGHPLGLNAINATFLVNDETVVLPTDDPSWQLPSFHRPAELFLWEIGNDVAHVMFLGRLPTVFLGLILAALTFRWAKDTSHNRWLALLALIFIALDPNIIAHSRLTTTDLGATLGATLAGYTLWRYLTTPTTVNALLAGCGFGLLNNTKFTAGLYVPLFTLAILLTWRHECRTNGLSATLRHHAKFIILFPLSAFICLWAGYGFQIGTLPDQLPALSQLSGLTLPLAHHLEQLLDIGNRSTLGAAAFLLGDYSHDGWWYYFPVAFLLKTPLATLSHITLALATFLFVDRSTPFHKTTSAALLLPSIGFIAIGMTTSVNLGYRHIMPILPFLIVFASYIFSLWQRRATLIIGGVILSGSLLLNSLTIAPDFLAFFNRLAGGPNHGWKSLVDSNLDWGQDLSSLATWVEANEVDNLSLSYFGEARPDYYSIPYTGLDSIPPRLMYPDYNPLYPSAPAAGRYAISATNLQGVLFADHDQFAWFREREPLAKIGYSIFIYEVEATGEPTALLLGESNLQEMPLSIYQQIGSNDTRPIWYNPATSTVFPALASVRITRDGEQWGIDNPEPAPDGEASAIMGPWSLIIEAVSAEFKHTTLTASTFWEVQSPTDAALRIFIHALDSDGNILGQSDLLDIHPATLLPGDRLSQQHQIDAITQPVTLRIGLYDWQSGERFGEPVVLPFTP